jgi:glucose-6-phosphate isomerase
MKNLQIDLKNALPFINQEEFKNYDKLVVEQDKKLNSKTGKGSEFLGWINLPETISTKLISEINQTTNDLRKISDIIVVIGIGGSFIGSKAIIQALSGSFGHLQTNKNPQVIFAGHNLSEDYHSELLEFLKDKQYSIVVISKSGTTTEPAIAFRILRKDLEKRFGKSEAQKRIVAITDKSKGALRELSDKEGYKTFTINDNIGGRYSVLSPVGLLPIACAGFNIENLLSGAKLMMVKAQNKNINQNPIYQYALIRHALYLQNKTTEILASFSPQLYSFSEWWKQLFGESEGKDNKGIFPANAIFSTDLHSMGQYIQDGLRNIFETIISVEKTKSNLKIPADTENFDNLNYLSEKNLDFVNKMAELGTIAAHVEGNVPNIKISIPELNEYYLGQLIYFFEKSCALSGYLLEVNPFDQPGVEKYKSNMFALLKKPGFENS